MYDYTKTGTRWSATYFESKLIPRMKKFEGAKLIQAHTGQRLTFCDVEFEILFTQEHFAPELVKNNNDASMVSRMTINGQTVLFTGDLYENATPRMVSLHGNYLKSDILQVNHHGNHGCSEALYRAVAPTYSFWTTSTPTFEKRTAGQTYPVGLPNQVDAVLNKMIVQELGRANCWEADGPVEIMTFSPGQRPQIEYYTIRSELLPPRPEYTGS